MVESRGVELFIVDRLGILLVDAHEEVGQYIHIVGECLIGCLVGREHRMCGSVVEVLGRHVEEMVGRLQVVPVLLESAVCTEAYAFGY